MSPSTDAHDPVPPSAWPTLTPVDAPAPAMPASWRCTALLHPFSPPPTTGPKPDTPFFQLCLADIVYQEDAFLSAMVAGCSYGTWWYVVTHSGTRLSVDRGRTWTVVDDLGWTLPSGWFGDQADAAACAGSAPLNWMPVPVVDWWKVPVPIEGQPAKAATWMWFDHSTGAPIRMMFGYGPPQPTKGDPGRLALFQMFSFSYVPEFEAGAFDLPETWSDPGFPGFAVGNPGGYQPFVWNDNFGFTALMTPVNEAFDPLPTRILYVWKADQQYAAASDRAQSSSMSYAYNPTNPDRIADQVALLMGPPPPGAPKPPDSDTGFLITGLVDGTQTCQKFGFAQEPPDWIAIPAVEGTVAATITDHPVICPGTTVTVWSALFPPAEPNYPEATFLWTWYAPQDATGTTSRPVTFMQSQSGVGVGTSLALADYYFWEQFAEPIDPGNFTVPDDCSAAEPE